MNAWSVSDPGDDIWARQSVWSQAADRLKLRIERARVIALGLTVTAALLATLATQVVALSSAAGRALALVSSVAVGLAPVARNRLASTSLADWTRARSVSQALKSELYTYLAGCGPYRVPDHDHLLATRCRQILHDADDLLRYTLGLHPAKRALPAVTDTSSYLQVRLEPQLRWYIERADELRTKLSRVSRAQFWLSVLGVVLAAIAATLGVDEAAAWVAVVATIIAAVSAYSAAARYEYQLVEYLRTVAQLERVRSTWSVSSQDSADSDAFVQECEQVISAQNEAWMAKLISGSDSATGRWG